jgi:hypothetical protein
MVNAGLVGVLFALHIVFAVLDWDLAFSLVALSISAQIVCFGPLTVILASESDRTKRRQLNRQASVVALPLALGLGWAYGDMAWSWLPVSTVFVLTVAVHAALDRRLALLVDA